MEHVILGFLLIRALSQYDIHKALQKEVSPFYKASLGSIQNALKKLEKMGCVTIQRINEGGRRKNIYEITDLGKKQFEEWMKGEVRESRFEAEVSVRLFFMGHLDRESRISIIKGYILFLEKMIKDMDEAEKVYQKQNVKEDYKEIVEYQFNTLDYGLHVYKATLEWFRNLLVKEETKAL
jgi:DNA-binding PadR family transcriptional regulator